MSIPVIKVPGSFSEKLRTSKPTRVFKPAKPGEFRGPPTDIIIPPLNTDIRFSRALPLTKLPKVFRAEKVPEKWDWVNEYPEDDDCTLERKKQITPVPDQGQCGSCWAVSTADAISDVFVAAGYPNPRCSPAYVLGCLNDNQYGCEGGNPGLLVVDIISNGIASDSCVDYSFCTKESCTRPWPGCGCYDPSDKHNLYFIQNPKLLAVVDESDKSKEVVNVIKAHILNKGPVVGGFAVFPNFMTDGKYIKTKGVYIENVDYTTTQEDKYIDMRYAQTEGGHAISIIGWGVEKDVKVGPNKVADVPYWLCRNSWTEKWGDKGYWKHAMFPYNQFSAFERATIISDDVSDMLGGGILAFSVGEIKPVNDLQKIDIKGALRENPEFYKADPVMEKSDCSRASGGGGENGGESGNSGSGRGRIVSSKQVNLLIFIALFVLVAVMIFFFLMRK